MSESTEEEKTKTKGLKKYSKAFVPKNKAVEET